jgi:hypothetical protein
VGGCERLDLAGTMNEETRKAIKEERRCIVDDLRRHADTYADLNDQWIVEECIDVIMERWAEDGDEW